MVHIFLSACLCLVEDIYQRKGFVDFWFNFWELYKLCYTRLKIDYTPTMFINQIKLWVFIFVPL